MGFGLHQRTAPPGVASLRSGCVGAWMASGPTSAQLQPAWPPWGAVVQESDEGCLLLVHQCCGECPSPSPGPPQRS